MAETAKEKLIRHLKLVLELYDEDEYVFEIATEALEYVKKTADPEREEDDGK